MPGAPGAPGTLAIFGNYEQIGNGTLEELMSPLSRSFLNVNGSVALDSNSRLNILLLNGDDPLGQTFSIMGYNSLVGQFSNGSSFWDDGFLWDITYGQHGVDVTAVSTPEPGFAYLSQHPYRVNSIQYALPGNLIDERLSVFRQSAGLRYFSSRSNERVLRRESDRP